MTPKPVKGAALRYNAATLARFQSKWLALINQMTRETTRELTALFKQEANVFDQSLEMRTLREVGLLRGDDIAAVMDASLADQAQAVIDRILGKFTVLFDRAATGIVSVLTADTLRDSQTGLQRSLKDISKDLTIKPTEQLKQTIDAAAQEAAGLIRRVPVDYLPMVQGDTMRSITTGNGLEDLVPALEKRNVKVKNWATNVAKDQTRKIYNNVNKVRMQDAGIKKFEWIHSGGSNKPRPLHIDAAPGGLNGGIFSFNDLPIIDDSTGERGIPGQLPYCGCTMRPIIEFDDDEE